jgi:hypothetical protein
MRAAILQPCYIPWKGVFDLMKDVDVFVYLDDVQYTTRDWRNRNKLKYPDGQSRWLTVPVRDGREAKICDVRVNDQEPWRSRHCQTLRHLYGKTPFFGTYFPEIEAILEDHRITLLADLDIRLTGLIASWLDIESTFHRSSDLGVEGTRDAHLIAICQAIGATSYLSGPSARSYIVPDRFAAAGIALDYKTYGPYPTYPQISEPFEHAVSVLDLLFMKGPESSQWIRASPS